MNKILGALDDFRSPEEKAKDYKISEIVASAAPVTWIEKSPQQWRKFSVRNQDGSSSCVKQSLSKCGEVLHFIETGEKVPFSAGFYKYRVNFPGEGMLGVDAFNIWRNKGMTLEKVLPSQNLNESQMNNLEVKPSTEQTAKAFKVNNFVQFNVGDFETVVSTISLTGKPVMVWFRFNFDEWTDVPFINTTSPQLHHSVTAIDYTLWNGKKAIIIEDSWGEFGQFIGQRVITEDFFRARNTFAAYPINFKKIEGGDSKPKYDGSIKSLQDCLKFEGLFPQNVESTGVFGAITKQAVKDFQKKYGIDQTGNIGPITTAKLRELYS